MRLSILPHLVSDECRQQGRVCALDVLSELVVVFALLRPIFILAYNWHAALGVSMIVLALIGTMTAIGIVAYEDNIFFPPMMDIPCAWSPVMGWLFVEHGVWRRSSEGTVMGRSARDGTCGA